ncbi:MAG TPA: hypothetical protein VNO32_65845 [Candidatus Acidoferrum sp.]|jgi:uncharacterized protein (TIGR02246 family)|nr:hypothetical protein [Candidatus Acidoferrum sp.]
MRRTSLVTILVFVAGLGIGYFGRSAVGTLQQRCTHKADLAAIEKLHQEDIEVTLSQDPQGLIDVWSDDGVRIHEGSPPVVGKQAIGAENEKVHAQYPEFKVLKYRTEITNVQIADGWAIEVGNVEAIYRMSTKDEPVNLKDTGLRLLKRQSDGSWKFALVGLK